MSVDCEIYVGYTVNLKTNLNSDDFDFFDEFEETHSEYNQYDCKGKVLLVVDGMCGGYARFIFVDEHIEDIWEHGREYCVLRNSSMPDDVYNELNKAYEAMYGKELDKSLVEYALWFHFS
jgi:hypothetical protein